MGNGNVHSADLLPTLLVGGAAGTVKGGRHIVGGTLTPNADLLISMAETFGVELEQFGGNKGRISSNPGNAIESRRADRRSRRSVRSLPSSARR